MIEDQIRHMVQRFLQWRLPNSFSPDAGITFTPEFNVEWNAKQGKPPQRHEPVGTNLFSAVEAEAMIRHMIDGMPRADALAISRADAEVIHRMMVEFFHAKTLSPEEATALMSLSAAGNFGRPVPEHGSGP